MGDWKKDRLTIEVKESEKVIMAEAQAKEDAETDQKWEEILEDVFSGDVLDYENVKRTLNTLREKGYKVTK